MWKASIVLLACLSFIAAQDADIINCDFRVYFGDYSCFLEGIELLDSTSNVTFVGQHLGDRADADVQSVEIWNSNTPFVISEIFTQFPNVVDLEIINSQLQTLRIPPGSNLEWIVLRDNNVSRIDRNSISNLERLEYFSARNNSIFEIDEEAFMGLPSLWYAGFINNNISAIAPLTFHSVIAARTIDFEGNNLTSIGDNIFQNNRNLTTLYLERNHIEFVSPTFSSNLQEGSSLSSVNFSGNRCIDRRFSTSDDFEWMILNAQLNTCFQNFVGRQETRRFIIETSGSFILRDQFGNVVAAM